MPVWMKISDVITGVSAHTRKSRTLNYTEEIYRENEKVLGEASSAARQMAYVAKNVAL
jgi:hypothetical protein